MSDFRSPTLIIAAHGSPVEPLVNQSIDGLARSIRATGEFTDVIAAYQYGDPWFSKGLEMAVSNHVIVVPLMTSEGYFTNVVLRDAMKPSREKQRVEITEPIGTHPDILRLIRNRVNAVMRQASWNPLETGVLLVGHGTRKHPNSRNATLQVALRLAVQKGIEFAEVAAGFLDDDPSIAEAASTLSLTQTVVVPFLIANGPHARVDIPRALGMAEKKQPFKPKLQKVGGRSYLLDQPLGVYPELKSLIIQRAFESSLSQTGLSTEARDDL